jgi:hypothetical protein
MKELIKTDIITKANDQTGKHVHLAALFGPPVSTLNTIWKTI